MVHNVGNLDRVLRIVVGLVLVAFGAGLVPGYGAQAWGWLGLIPLATALMGWCPAYAIFGIDTCGKRLT